MKKLKFNKFSKQKMIVFAAIFAAAGLVTLTLSSASTTLVHEAEQGALSPVCASIVDDSSASGSKALTFGCPEIPPPVAGFVHPGVVYTQGDIDSWSTTSPEYSRLAGTCAGSLNPSGSCVTRSAPVVYGTQIENAGDAKDDANELNLGFKDQSGFAKIQAVLWAADNNNARKDKVISYLQEYRSVTSIQFDTAEQYRLVSGWSCTNLAQAAEIINYQDAQFKRFLKEVCYPVLDWNTGPNWHASFADSRLAIAAYLGDNELWADAKRYFNERIKQSIYHSTYDSNKVNPIHTEDLSTAINNSSGVKIGSTTPSRLHTSTGTPNVNATRSQWGGGIMQINTDYTFTAAVAPIIDGVNAERMRDLAHVNMSYGAWISAARTIRAQGEEIEPDAYARLLAGWGYHAGRVLAYLQTGTVPTPVPATIEGGAQFKQGFYGAKIFFGSATPQSILDALQRPEVTNFPAAGSLHMVGEAFADGTGESN